MSNAIADSIASILAAVARAISRWRARSASPPAPRRDGSPLRSRVGTPAASSGWPFFFLRKEKIPKSVPSAMWRACAMHDSRTAAAPRPARVRGVKTTAREA
jgi:hypothetical protein